MEGIEIDLIQMLDCRERRNFIEILNRLSILPLLQSQS
jgi:hypothetical protein